MKLEFDGLEGQVNRGHECHSWPVWEADWKLDGKVILCDGRQLAKPQHQKREDTDMKDQGFRCEATEKNENLEITSEKWRGEELWRSGVLQRKKKSYITRLQDCREIARLTNTCPLVPDTFHLQTYTLNKTINKFTTTFQNKFLLKLQYGLHC